MKAILNHVAKTIDKAIVDTKASQERDRKRYSEDNLDFRLINFEYNKILGRLNAAKKPLANQYF